MAEMQEGRSARKRQVTRRHVSYATEGGSVSGLVCQLPYCGLSLPDAQRLEEHYNNHLTEAIKKIDRNGSTRRPPQLADRVRSCRRWQAFEQLQDRRHRRRLRCREDSGSSGRDTAVAAVACLLCDQVIVERDPEAHALHLVTCLSKEEAETGNEVLLEGEEETNYEMYEWAGQSRIRPISLLDVSDLQSATGFVRLQKTAEDEELDVTGDLVEDLFGPQQYGEGDVASASLLQAEAGPSDAPSNLDSVLHNGRGRTRDSNKREIVNGESPHYELPELESTGNVDLTPSVDISTFVLSSSSQRETSIPAVDHSSPLEVNQPISTKEFIKSGSSSSGATVYSHIDHLTPAKGFSSPASAAGPVIDHSTNLAACRVCLEPAYRVPLVSIVCWHVHCEACWLLCLAAKKLCPQCKEIVQPGDLRRIYI